MGDMENAVNACQQAQDESTEISDSAARVIASMYHEGQTSASYGFASTGHITSARDQAVRDLDVALLWRDLFPRYDQLSTDERLLADMLGTYLIQRNRDGRLDVVEGWPHLWL
jgi:hypothetical protein